MVSRLWGDSFPLPPLHFSYSTTCSSSHVVPSLGLHQLWCRCCKCPSDSLTSTVSKQAEQKAFMVVKHVVKAHSAPNTQLMGWAVPDPASQPGTRWKSPCSCGAVRTRCTAVFRKLPVFKMRCLGRAILPRKCLLSFPGPCESILKSWIALHFSHL